MEAIALEAVPFIDVRPVAAAAVRDVFDMMLDMELDYLPEMEQPYLYGPRYLGAVDLAGTVQGTVKIQAGVTLAGRMAAAMLGMPGEEPDELEVRDVLGELTNMVGGAVKSALCDAGFGCELSSPAITTGKDFTAENGALAHVVYLTFYHRDMPFLVEVGLKEGDAIQPEVKGGRLPESDRSGAIGRFDIAGGVSGTVTEVFEMMLGMPLEPAEGGTPDGSGRRFAGAVSFAGQVLGRLSLEVGEGFGRQMAAAMLGMSPSEIEGGEEIKDVVGELTNMVGGNLKSALCDAGLTCELSPPGFTSGHDFEVDLLAMARRETLAFRWGDHVLVVDVGLKPPA